MPMLGDHKKTAYDPIVHRQYAVRDGSRPVIVGDTDAHDLTLSEYVRDTYFPLAKSTQGAIRAMCRNFNRCIPTYHRLGRWEEKNFSATHDAVTNLYVVTVDPDAYGI